MTPKLFRSLLYYLATGLCIAGLAFVNHYPLVYSDSGAYIQNAIRLYQVDDRPIGYGLIIRAVTWQGTLWTVVLFQGAIASWLIMLLVREVVSDRARWLKAHLVLLTLLILCSSLPWYAAQIMADHFTPLVVLIAFLLFHGKGLGPWREGALWILLFFFLSTHNAHLPMAAVLVGVLLVTAMRKGVAGTARSFWFRWAGFNVAIGGAALMTMLFTWSAHGQMRLSRAGNVFLAGRLCEAGIMKDYLDEVCPAPGNPLCPYKDDLPGDAGGMLWDTNGLPTRAQVTIGQADSLLAPVVSDVLSRPEFLVRYIRSGIVSTAVQLFQWEAGSGLDQYGKGSSPYWNLEGKIPDEWYSYTHGRQQWGYWTERSDANRREAIALVLSLLVLALYRLDRKPGERTLLASLSRWVALWIVLNAAVTSSVSVVDPRLQSRVMWLLPMVAFLVLVQQPSLRDFFRLGPGKVSANPGPRDE